MLCHYPSRMLVQGIVALLALNILEADKEHPQEAWGSSAHLHTAIESLRLAFADGLQHNADHRHVKVPHIGMSDKQYAARRRKNNFKPQKVCHNCLLFSELRHNAYIRVKIVKLHICQHCTVKHVDKAPCYQSMCCAVLCCAVLCCAVLCCAVLCCAVLCCAVLRCAVLCCDALRCAVELIMHHG